MNSLGVGMVKTGYVGKILPKGEYHQGQYMVNHYHYVIETAAKYHIAVNAHEGIKATGKRRTYPNEVARETFRGQEFNGWSSDGGNPPEHLTLLAFTANLAGPMDYTPGIFNLTLKPYREKNRVSTTLAHQLALYVTINSPIQMAADLIQYYKGHPAFKFIEDVPVNWEQTKALEAAVGDYVAIARQERGTDNWFIGAITDENARQMELDLDFLSANAQYLATLYTDAPDANWETNPTAYRIDTLTVDATTKLKLNLATGGGAAISLVKKP
jgi:glucan 1,4-alpha-glucosidase